MQVYRQCITNFSTFLMKILSTSKNFGHLKSVSKNFDKHKYAVSACTNGLKGEGRSILFMHAEDFPCLGLEYVRGCPVYHIATPHYHG